MPTRALRACSHCGTLTRGGGGVCTKCAAFAQRRWDEARGTHTARGYDAAWERLVALAIHDRPFCADCGLERQVATYYGNPLSGDHRRWPAVDPDDVIVVCRRCNSKRGKVRRRRLGGFA